jgi:hypothetical protein
VDTGHHGISLGFGAVEIAFQAPYPVEALRETGHSTAGPNDPLQLGKFWHMSVAYARRPAYA